MPTTPSDIARNIDRFYEHATDGDPEGQRRAHNIFGGVLEDLCDPDSFDLEGTYKAMSEADRRALVWFAAQVVVELHDLGWDAEQAYVRWNAQRGEN